MEWHGVRGVDDACIIQLIYAVGQCLVFTLRGFRFCLFAYKSFCIIYA